MGLLGGLSFSPSLPAEAQLLGQRALSCTVVISLSRCLGQGPRGGWIAGLTVVPKSLGSLRKMTASLVCTAASSKAFV